MKLFIVLALALCFFGTLACASQNEEILAAVEAIEHMKSEFLSKLDTVESDSALGTMCCTASSLTIRTDYGSSTGRYLSNGQQVTVQTTKQMRGLEYGKIGTQQWVAMKYLRSCGGSTPTPTPTPEPTSVEKCSTTNSLTIRSDSGASTGRYLSNGEKVTVQGTKQMRGLEYSKIGSQKWVASKYLGTCAPSNPSSPSTGGKAAEALKEILGSEGNCQNWSNDSGNRFEGRIGYTCAGIIPSVGYNNRFSAFSYAANSFNGHPSMFVKYAYDMNRAKFIEGASKVYVEKYFGPGGCSNLPQPAYYVCCDIAVNSGVGRSRQFLNEFGPLRSTTPSGIKDYARKLNERHRQFYKYIGRPGTKNNRFLRGWLNRADHRDRYINNYRI